MEAEQKAAAAEGMFDILRRTMPFQVVSDGMLQKVAALGRREVHAAGQILYDVGDKADDIYIIVSGQV